MPATIASFVAKAWYLRMPLSAKVINTHPISTQASIDRKLHRGRREVPLTLRISWIKTIKVLSSTGNNKPHVDFGHRELTCNGKACQRTSPSRSESLSSCAGISRMSIFSGVSLSIPMKSTSPRVNPGYCFCHGCQDRSFLGFPRLVPSLGLYNEAHAFHVVQRVDQNPPAVLKKPSPN
ncbi:hypothetical protein VFPPC_17948 [Pochonia chlamydosporia 170]|uniref:Uncharacterized protein n=1 Tax=Pochonia chlamydosporia 170 TaxID=1380566 RepID=A0A219AQF7_METCM|nr:hypothetical protein VFPPC_17948 [Pochonia chlamydosporia 170]OWT42859.1 hypothetical protein VFPPC_17948 [Pochonia chlamydosporia 170]